MALRILLTGGAGFIGSHLTDALIAAGHHVAVVDDLSAGSERNLNPRAEFYPADIRSSLLKEVFDRERPEVVYHLAAQASVITSMRRPDYDASINVLGSLQILELSRRSRVRKVIYASTGGALYGEPRHLPCTEDHEISPLSPYGVTKFSVERYLHIYRQAYGLDYSILRYGNVYGPRQGPHGEAGVIAIFAQRMVEGGTCVIYGTGEQERDFVYVDDVVRANLSAMESASGEALNIATGRGTTVKQVFSGLSEAVGYGDPPKYEAARPGEVHRIYLDCSKAQRLLGWGATTPFEEGIRRTVSHMMNDVSRGLGEGLVAL
jgi:UDP-glucose 4-epimerase